MRVTLAPSGEHDRIICAASAMWAVAGIIVAACRLSTWLLTIAVCRSYDHKSSASLLCPRRRGGGIKRYRDPPVCLSQGAAALGYRHADCLTRHRRPPEMGGLRTRPRTDVDPPRFWGPWTVSYTHLTLPTKRIV